MCLAVPMKLISIEGDSGVAEQSGVTLPVNVMLIDNPQVGDYVIIHAGFAIQKMSEAEALETLGIFQEINQALPPEADLPQARHAGEQ